MTLFGGITKVPLTIEIHCMAIERGHTLNAVGIRYLVMIYYGGIILIDFKSVSLKYYPKYMYMFV